MPYFKGQRATEAFEDVGHSKEARELMKDYHIGELAKVRNYIIYIFTSINWPNLCLRGIIHQDASDELYQKTSQKLT